MELAKAELPIKKIKASKTGELIALTDNVKINKLEKKYGHFSPQELMDTDISDRKKRILSGIQIIALKSLETLGADVATDTIELVAWQECHDKASGEVLVELRVDSI